MNKHQPLQYSNIRNILKKITHIIIFVLFVMISSACSTGNSDTYTGLKMLRDFAEIPENTPVTMNQAKDSLDKRIPLGSTKQDVLDYISRKENKDVRCYWNDDRSEISCRIVYSSAKKLVYVTEFIFDNNQSLKEIKVYQWGPASL